MDLTFTLGEGVTETQRDIVGDNLAVVVAEIEELTGYRVDTFDVWVFADPDTYVAAMARQEGISEGEWNRRHASLQTATGGHGLLTLGFNPNVKVRERIDNLVDVLAHEYVHVLQAELAYGPPSHPSGRGAPEPTWMLEGVATYLTDRISRQRAQEAMWCHPDCLIDALDGWLNRTWARWGPRLEHVPLESTEVVERVGWSTDEEQAAYTMGSLASHQLAERADPSALLDFYANLPNAQSWQEAFAETFAVEVDTFYREFAAWRTGQETER